MVKPIVRDMLFLAAKSETATAEHAQVAQDLLDTLAANSERCVGMAANMIGVPVRIIVFAGVGGAQVMFNPEIVKKSGEYEAEEGCLSLDGVRPTKRYRSIEVSWQDRLMRRHRTKLTGFAAQIVQHEIDHCDGILI